MADQVDCPECGNEITSADDVESDGEIAEIEPENDSVTLYGNRDLYRCKDCKKALGVGRS
jgi:predicted RNA-binding Zn-ribbon protein involved in translation (DUF1610 family)